jgi:hypothetical protein
VPANPRFCHNFFSRRKMCRIPQGAFLAKEFLRSQKKDVDTRAKDDDDRPLLINTNRGRNIPHHKVVAGWFIKKKAGPVLLASPKHIIKNDMCSPPSRYGKILWEGNFLVRNAWSKKIPNGYCRNRRWNARTWQSVNFTIFYENTGFYL